MNMNISPLQKPSSPSSTVFSITTTSELENDFYAVIERLKLQRAIPQDSFAKDLPFFNITAVSKESQIKQLFEDASDPDLYKTLLKTMISLPIEAKSPELLSKRLSAMQVMNFAQIVLYKVLPCPEQDCPNCPREVAPGNQYKDYEYSCPFYHHERDRRRLVITPNIEDEFTYKANYLMDNKNGTLKEKHSLNYFESMFHPIYYKMFQCKRKYCNFSPFCPAFHTEDEKKTWDNMFANFVRKDRVLYVRDKQKYMDSNSSPCDHQQKLNFKAKSVTNSPNAYVSDFRSKTNRMNYNKLRNITTQMHQVETSDLCQALENKSEWRSDMKTEPQSASTWDHNSKMKQQKKNHENKKKIAMQNLRGFEKFEPKEAVDRIC